MMLDMVFFILIGMTMGWSLHQFQRGSGFNVYLKVILGALGAVAMNYFSILMNIKLFDGIVQLLVLSILGAIIFIFTAGFLLNPKVDLIE